MVHYGMMLRVMCIYFVVTLYIVFYSIISTCLNTIVNSSTQDGKGDTSSSIIMLRQSITFSDKTSRAITSDAL